MQLFTWIIPLYFFSYVKTWPLLREPLHNQDISRFCFWFQQFISRALLWNPTVFYLLLSWASADHLWNIAILASWSQLLEIWEAFTLWRINLQDFQITMRSYKLISGGFFFFFHIFFECIFCIVFHRIGYQMFYAFLGEAGWSLTNLTYFWELSGIWLSGGLSANLLGMFPSRCDDGYFASSNVSGFLLLISIPSCAAD